MADVSLIVNGQAYGGWKSVRVTRTIEAIAGSFALSVSERWGGRLEPWPVREEDECQVQIDRVPVVTGYVDVREISYDHGSHSLSFSGRDRTGMLVDCSAVLDRYEFRNVPILDLCQTLAEPFQIAVRLQEGLDDRAVSLQKAETGGAPAAVGSAGKSSSMKLRSPAARVTINPGDSPFEVIDRACRLVGVLPVADGRGGLVLIRAGGARATTSLVDGENVLEVRARFDASRRYRRYIVSGQSGGSDDLFGAAAAAVRGVGEDGGVRRASRVLLVRPEGAVTPAFASQRAAWEATVRRARAQSLDVTVQGWQQGDGTLWPLNATVSTRLPKAGVDGLMLIVAVTHSLSDEAGSLTTISLVPPDAYIPEPVIPDTSTTSSGALRFLQ